MLAVTPDLLIMQHCDWLHSADMIGYLSYRLMVTDTLSMTALGVLMEFTQQQDNDASMWWMNVKARLSCYQLYVYRYCKVVSDRISGVQQGSLHQG